MVYSIRGTPIKYTRYGSKFDNCLEFLNSLSKSYVKSRRTLFKKNWNFSFMSMYVLGQLCTYHLKMLRNMLVIF